MNTKQITLVVSSAVASALLTGLIFSYIDHGSATAGITKSALTSNADIDVSSIETRLQRLEQLLTKERDSRQALEQMLGQTTGPDQDLNMRAMIESMQQEMIISESNNAENSEAQQAAFREQRRTQMIERMQPEFKIKELVNAGFNQDEANWIVENETEVQLAQLQAQYAARRLELNDPNSRNNLAAYANDQMRNKLGDEYYERYLKARGMPTSIPVGSVMKNSPGANAGLLPGDDIVAYDNKRVFSAFGLNRMTASGKQGENVLIEIKRDGESIQLTIPRGPIGVQSSQFGRRR